MSKFFPAVKKRNRRLVKVVRDGNAKTFVYKDLDEQENKDSFWSRIFCKQTEKSGEEDHLS